MAPIVIAFTREGVIVADGAVAVARALEFAKSGEATVVVVNAANNAAPAADIVLNMESIAVFSAAVTSGNAAEATKAAFATALGTMAAIGATPWAGPAGAIAFGELFSRTYAEAFDAASALSANHDWLPLFDLLDGWSNGGLPPVRSTWNIEGWGDISNTTLTQTRNLWSDSQQSSPLVLDLDGNGVQTTALAQGAYFDHNGNGLAENTGWVGAGDALLVRDLNGNGRIDSGAELFGNETTLAGGGDAANGFAALAALDSNADGKVSAQDAAWAGLQLWKDLNGNGQPLPDGGMRRCPQVNRRWLGKPPAPCAPTTGAASPASGFARAVRRAAPKTSLCCRAGQQPVSS